MSCLPALTDFVTSSTRDFFRTQSCQKFNVVITLNIRITAAALRNAVETMTRDAKKKELFEMAGNGIWSSITLLINLP